MKNFLSINNLSFSFENGKTIFSDFSHTFQTSGLYFVQGRNGTGKSTLFSLLQGTIPFHSKIFGTINFNKTPLKVGSEEHKKYAAEHISKVDQKFDSLLAPHLTFIENLQCALFVSHPTFELIPKEPKLPEFLKEFNIPVNNVVGKLSGGQRQILAILMCIQKPTSILLLDEPTAALDTKNAQLVMDFLKILQQEKNMLILMICHDPELLEYSQHKPLTL